MMAERRRSIAATLSTSDMLDRPRFSRINLLIDQVGKQNKVPKTIAPAFRQSSVSNCQRLDHDPKTFHERLHPVPSRLLARLRRCHDKGIEACSKSKYRRESRVQK